MSSEAVLSAWVDILFYGSMKKGVVVSRAGLVEVLILMALYNKTCSGLCSTEVDQGWSGYGRVSMFGTC